MKKKPILFVGASTIFKVDKDDLPSSEAIRYAEEQTRIYKQQVIKATDDYIKISKRWDSLREWLEEDLKQVYRDCGYRNNIMREALDKMNELEGKDKE